MARLNLDLSYFENMKTKRLVGRLGRGAEVLPLKLWAYCGKVHPSDGKLTGYTESEIETIVEWWGKAGACIEALLAIRFLIKTDDGYQVHQWDEHEGHLSAYHIRAKKGAEAKWAKLRKEPNASSIDATSNASSNAVSNASSMLQAMPQQCMHDMQSKQNSGRARDGPEEALDGDPVDAQIRQLFNSHPLLPPWSKVHHDRIRRAVNAYGWDWVHAMLDKAAGQHADLLEYLAGCVKREARSGNAEGPQRQVKSETWNS